MKDGSTPRTVKIKGKYLHSPYNPRREAERVIGSECYEGKTVLILFEPGLGYLAETLLKRSGHARLLIISPLDLLVPEIRNHQRVSRWKGDLEEGLRAFLAEHLHESDINTLAYIPWPPAVRLMPDEAARAGRTLSSFLKTLQANHAHLRGFGRADLKNSLINSLESPVPRIPRLKGVPVVIAASGPSLEEHVEKLAGGEKGYFIIALPSAVKALAGSGVRPHLILSTDPGYWASRHFRHFPREIPVGTGLNGRRGRSEGSPIFPIINQMTFTDKSLLEGWSLPSVASAGSVALTALDLAKALGASSVTFAGLDLSMRDIKSHAAPHSFDAFLWSGSNRFTSIHQIHFDRAAAMTLSKEGPLRFGPALEQYRNWLARRRDYPPLYRLAGDFPPVDNLEDISELKGSSPFGEEWYEAPHPSLSERADRAVHLLKNWQRDAGELMSEPDSLILPEKEEFKDFLYTLVPEEYSALKTAQSLGRESGLLRRNAKEKLLAVFHEMEVLVERIS